MGLVRVRVVAWVNSFPSIVIYRVQASNACTTPVLLRVFYAMALMSAFQHRYCLVKDSLDSSRS